MSPRKDTDKIWNKQTNKTKLQNWNKDGPGQSSPYATHISKCEAVQVQCWTPAYCWCTGGNNADTPNSGGDIHNLGHATTAQVSVLNSGELHDSSTLPGFLGAKGGSSTTFSCSSIARLRVDFSSSWY